MTCRAVPGRSFRPEAAVMGYMTPACVGPDWAWICVVAAFIAGAARGSS